MPARTGAGGRHWAKCRISPKTLRRIRPKSDTPRGICDTLPTQGDSSVEQCDNSAALGGKFQRRCGNSTTDCNSLPRRCDTLSRFCDKSTTRGDRTRRSCDRSEKECRNSLVSCRMSAESCDRITTHGDSSERNCRSSSRSCHNSSLKGDKLTRSCDRSLLSCDRSTRCATARRGVATDDRGPALTLSSTALVRGTSWEQSPSTPIQAAGAAGGSED
jgi:hypothetical protein